MVRLGSGRKGEGMGDDSHDEQQQPITDGGAPEPRQSNPPPDPIFIAPAGLFELKHLGFDRYAAVRPGGGGPGAPPIFPLKIEVHPSFVDQYVHLPNVVLSIALTGRDRPISYFIKTPGQALPIEQHPTRGTQPWPMQHKDVGGGRRGHWLNFDIRDPFEGMRIQVEVHPNVDHQLRRGCDHMLVWRGGQIHAEPL
jgi:hypothetical protein